MKMKTIISVVTVLVFGICADVHAKSHKKDKESKKEKKDKKEHKVAQQKPKEQPIAKPPAPPKEQPIPQYIAPPKDIVKNVPIIQEPIVKELPKEIVETPKPVEVIEPQPEIVEEKTVEAPEIVEILPVIADEPSNEVVESRVDEVSVEVSEFAEIDEDHFDVSADDEEV